MRLIDADELMTAFPCGESIRTESVRATIDHAPTIDLVRCGECKHNSLKRMSGNAFCELGHAFSQLYDYCSDGERRADDD